MLKRILWALAPVVASKIMNKRRGAKNNSRADKTSWDKKRRR